MEKRKTATKAKALQPQDDPRIPKRFERDAVTIGLAIRAVRAASDRPRSGLARYLGVSESTVYTWEKGKADPSFRQVLRIMDYLDQPFDMLIGNLGPPNRASRLS